jgi:hypothetical protein
MEVLDLNKLRLRRFPHQPYCAWALYGEQGLGSPAGPVLAPRGQRRKYWRDVLDDNRGLALALVPPQPQRPIHPCRREIGPVEPASVVEVLMAIPSRSSASRGRLLW